MATLDTPLVVPGKTFEYDAKVHKANAKNLEDFAQSITPQLVPVGTIIAYAGATVPSGWLPCDGSQASRATYATLFFIIGTNYGVGDGVTTFNLPDLIPSASTDKRVLTGTGTGVVLGTTVNMTATAGTDTKGVAVNFIIKT